MPRIESHGGRTCHVVRAARPAHRICASFALHTSTSACPGPGQHARLTARVCARACARVGVSVREHRAHGMCARHARAQLPRPQLTAAHSQPHRDGRARATSMHRPLTALRTAQYRTRPRPLSLTPRMRTLTRSCHAQEAAAHMRSFQVGASPRKLLLDGEHALLGIPRSSLRRRMHAVGRMPMHCTRQEMGTVRTAEPQLRRRRAAD